MAAATSSFTCLAFMAKGFSHKTFFPALRKSRPTLQCSVCRTPTYTTSGRGNNTLILCLCPKVVTCSSLTNVRVFSQLLVAAIGLRNTMLLGELLGTLQASGCNDGYLHIRRKEKKHSTFISLLLCQQQMRHLKEGMTTWLSGCSTWWSPGGKVFIATLKSWLIFPASQSPQRVAMLIIGSKWPVWCLSKNLTCLRVLTLDTVANRQQFNNSTVAFIFKVGRSSHHLPSQG